jgi:hypothetical protein
MSDGNDKKPARQPDIPSSAEFAHLYESPLVDITTIIGVESGFRIGITDPWFDKCFQELVDLAIYADNPRYAVPIVNTGVDPRDVPVPPLLVELNKYSDLRFTPEPFVATETPILKNEYLEEVIVHFIKWIGSRTNTVVQFSKLQFSDFVEREHATRIGRRTLFDLHEFESPRADSGHV